MNKLSPSAQRLVRAGAQAARPTEADRRRLFAAMQARLGDGAMLGEGSASVAQPVTHAVWVKASALAVSVGLLVAGGMALRPAALPSSSPAVQSPTLTVPLGAPAALAMPTVVTGVSGLPDAPEAPKATGLPATSAARRSPDRLAQEVALLSRATSALRSGRAGDALKALGEHQSQFPKGLLVEERRAARAQALCALGRRAEAETELSRLAQTAPQSAQAARARQACRLEH